MTNESFLLDDYMMWSFHISGKCSYVETRKSVQNVNHNADVFLLYLRVTSQIYKDKINNTVCVMYRQNTAVQDGNSGL